MAAGVGTAASILLVLVTVASLIRTDWKWIRIWDFPRLQIAVLCAVVLALDLLVLKGAWRWPLTACLGAALAYQLWRIFPYTPLAARQAGDASANQPDDCVRILISNVRMANRESDRLLGVVGNADPDVAFFVETDDWWVDALSPLDRKYPTAVSIPKDNTYGMILYSRLPVEEHEIGYLVEDDIPSVHLRISLKSGQQVMLHGIHPAPPPLSDTEERNAEILIVGRMCQQCPLPSIVFGDLNDVGWSRTTSLFIRTSQLVDPRLGRGLFATYHAALPFLRWPLDHIFHDARFKVKALRLMPNVGSDHLPIVAELCYEPEEAQENAPPPPDEDDRQEARAAIRKGTDRPPPSHEPPTAG